MKPVLPDIASVAPFLQRMQDRQAYSNFGPLVMELETRYADFLKVPRDQVVSVANCTLGLQGAISITEVNQWLAPDFTFPATGLAVRNAGRQLFLGDVDKSTLFLQSELIHDLPEHFGIVPVAPFGAPIRLDTWADREFVVVDAAASLGTQPDLAVLPETWAVVFSLHATKVLPAGEGGIAVFGSADQAGKFRTWTNFGFAGSRVATYEGTNAKMSEIHAAYALASLQDWEHERFDWSQLRARISVSECDFQSLSSLPGSEAINPYWIVECETPQQLQTLETYCLESGIGTRRWWPKPLHASPAFSDCKVIGDIQVASDLSELLLGLPMFRGLSDSEFELVCAQIRKSA